MFNAFYCKAKIKNTNEWEYGNIFNGFDKTYIITELSDNHIKKVEVDPLTVCQCTGFRDYTGQLIFEHDICKCPIFAYDKNSDMPPTKYYEFFEVRKNNHTGGFFFYGVNTIHLYDFHYSNCAEVVVVGNSKDKEEKQS